MLAREASLTRRITVIATLTVVVVMILAALASALLIRAHVERTFDARLREDAQFLAAGLSFDKDGVLSISSMPENREYIEPLSGWYWIVHSGDVVLTGSRSLAATSLTSGTPSLVTDAEGPGGQKLRLYAISRTNLFGQPLTITVAAPRSAIDDAVSSEVAQLFAGLAVLGALLIAMVWWQVARSLRPLGKLSRDVARLAVGDLETLPPVQFAELARLSSTINEMLDHTRQTALAHRDRAAKLAHALKTPLALIAARAEGDDGSRDLNVLEAVASMQRQIDHNLRRSRAAYRSPAFATRVAVKSTVDDLMFAMQHAYRSRDIAQSVDVDESIYFVGDREDLEEMLGNLVENAHRWARSCVSVSATAEQDTLTIAVTDDGPGFPDDILRAYTPSTDRMSDQRSPGGGLGLAVTREIAAGYSGSLSLANGEASGASAVLRLPTWRIR